MRERLDHERFVCGRRRGGSGADSRLDEGAQFRRFGASCRLKDAQRVLPASLSPVQLAEGVECTAESCEHLGPGDFAASAAQRQSLLGVLRGEGREFGGEVCFGDAEVCGALPQPWAAVPEHRQCPLEFFICLAEPTRCPERDGVGGSARPASAWRMRCCRSNSCHEGRRPVRPTATAWYRRIRQGPPPGGHYGTEPASAARATAPAAGARPSARSVPTPPPRGSPTPDPCPGGIPGVRDAIPSTAPAVRPRTGTAAPRAAPRPTEPVAG